MSQALDPPLGGPTLEEPPTDAYEVALHKELDRRIKQLASYPEDTFGHITQREWIAFFVISLVIPVLLVWSLA